MHVSTFYLCKMFRKATGLTFTNYLGRVRATVLLISQRRLESPTHFTWRTTDGSNMPSRWPGMSLHEQPNFRNQTLDRIKDEITLGECNESAVTSDCSLR
jgi:hypothetical protein